MSTDASCASQADEGTAEGETQPSIPVADPPQTDRSTCDHRDRQVPIGPTADAGVPPDSDTGILCVCILDLASDACDRQTDTLLCELNATRAVFPGTARKGH